MREIKIIAPAKINLDLKITGSRDDGYHLLNSLMAFTQWGDEIIITAADKFGLTITGAYAPFIHVPMEKNLVTRAVRAMEEASGESANIHITLQKNIPVGAGLGGGSSDAAAIMLYLNTLWDNPLTLDQLVEIGLTLGADLPICLYQKICRVEGIGDVINPVSMPEEYQDKWVVVAWPDRGLLTKDVFAAYHIHAKLPNDVPNDLQEAACSLSPDIRHILNVFSTDNECVFYSMSGSGAACFGLYETEEAAQANRSNHKNSIITRWIDMPSI